MNLISAESVKRARRCIDSAQALFRDGLLPECHEYWVKALGLLLEAWAGTGNAPRDDGGPLSARALQGEALQALERASYPHRDRLRAALVAMGLPEAAIAGPELPRDFDSIWVQIERLANFSAGYALTPSARKQRRVRQSIAGISLLLIGLFLGLRIWGRPRALASATLRDAYAAANVVDGMEATEWLLPDATLGWIDLVLPSPRTVHRVRLWNSHNVYYADRATQAVRVTAFTKQGQGASAERAFKEITEDRSVLDVPLEAEGVTRIRVEVLSYFKTGGGLAEIEVD